MSDGSGKRRIGKNHTLVTAGEFFLDLIFYDLDRLPKLGEELKTERFALLAWRGSRNLGLSRLPAGPSDPAGYGLGGLSVGQGSPGAATRFRSRFRLVEDRIGHNIWAHGGGVDQGRPLFFDFSGG